MEDPRDTGPDSAGDGRLQESAADDGEPDETDVVRRLYGKIPFHQANDVRVLVVTPRHAELKLPFDADLVGNPDLAVLHGGAISALLDHTGAAVFIGQCGDYTPTVDLRVNYLEAAGRKPLYATATVERRGADIGVASVEVESGESVCATGTGVYKLSDD